jgi:hypothetical protein
MPNTAIVVGSHATLVVELGPKNGATVARVAAGLAPNNAKLFLTTTHFHPEHAGGEAGFPPGRTDAPAVQMANTGLSQPMSTALPKIIKKSSGSEFLGKMDCCFSYT